MPFGNRSPCCEYTAAGRPYASYLNSLRHGLISLLGVWLSAGWNKQPVLRERTEKKWELLRLRPVGSRPNETNISRPALIIYRRLEVQRPHT